MLPGGKLYVPGAEKIIPNIKRLVDEARAEPRVFGFQRRRSHTGRSRISSFSSALREGQLRCRDYSGRLSAAIA